MKGCEKMLIDYQKFFIACARAEITATAAIEKAGLSSFILTKIKHGNNVTTLTVGKLAKALNVPVEELVVFKNG